jgi:hypothetical protein
VNPKVGPEVEHMAAAQVAVDVWQAPPTQSPVLPQGLVAAQPPCGSAVAFATLTQVPPAPVQAWQVGQLDVPQQ